MSTRLSRIAAAAIAVGMLGAAPAHANAGTGMMWLGMAHLFIGNAFIGLLEWGLLHLLLRSFWRRGGGGAGHLVAANYVSAWAGVLLLGKVWPTLIQQYCPQPLLQAEAVIAVSWVGLFAVTVLMEWPFVRAGARAASDRALAWGPALAATVIINLASYAVLVPLYYRVCPVSLVTETSIVSAREVAGNLKARVYYLSPDGDVWETRADGTGQRQVAATALKSKYPEIMLVANPKTGWLDLYADSHIEAKNALCVRRKVARVPRFEDDPKMVGAEHRPPYDGHRTPGRAHDRACDLRAPDGDSVWIGTWAAEGVGLSGDGGDRIRFALETPFLALVPGYGSVLDGDKLICQFTNMVGPRQPQIVLLDLRGKRLAVLAEGSNPLVVLDELPQGASWWQPKPSDDYDPLFINYRVRGGKP